MIAYILRRLMHAAVVVIVVSVLIFLVLRLLPGDPILMYVSSGAAQQVSAEQIAQLKHTYGLDQPLLIQYGRWALNALHGDLGKSLLFQYDVRAEILRRLPISLSLGLTGLIIGGLIGPLVGAASAVKRGSWLDSVLTTAANVGITAPNFLVAILLIFIFGVKLGILPVYGYTSPFENLGESLRQAIMPIAVLALFPLAASARQARSSVLDVVGQDYVRTARAKGLSQRTVVARHVLRNALMPVATIQGELFRNLIAGAVVVESVFVVPGMGRLLITSMLSYDYPVVEGIILVASIGVVLVNLAVDLIYAVLDPRIKYQ